MLDENLTHHRLIYICSLYVCTGTLKLKLKWDLFNSYISSTYALCSFGWKSLNDLSRITRRQSVGRNIFIDQCAGGNDCSLIDGYTG